MKQWRKQPNRGTAFGTNVKRLQNKFMPTLVPLPPVLMQQLLLRAGVWA